MERSLTESEKDLLKFWSHIPWDQQDETLMVLKGHLLIEDLMREYCGTKVEKEGELEKAHLTFRQVVHLTKSFQKYAAASWIWGAVEKINVLRNRLAHRLTPAGYEELRKDFVDFVKKEAASGKPLFETVKEPHQEIGACIFIAYTALSVHLRFKPKGLLASAMENLRVSGRGHR